MTPRRIWLGARSAGGLALPAANPTASQLYAPRGVWLDGQRLCVADSGNHRVLIWNSLPTVDQAPADIVLGQASFTAEGPAAQGRGPENGFHLPTGLIVVGNALLVTDPWHHRVLVWNQVPTVSDTPPDFCLGQKSLHDVERNRGGEVGRDTLYWPYGVAWIGGRLHVADTGNRRVLIWNGLPTADAPADVVLGQSDACSAEENRGGPVGPASFRWPHALAGTAEQLWVADAGNHRVLGWQGAPAGDRPADWVVGQENFTSNWEMPHQAQGPARPDRPQAAQLPPRLLLLRQGRLLLLLAVESHHSPCRQATDRRDGAASCPCASRISSPCGGACGAPCRLRARRRGLPGLQRHQQRPPSLVRTPQQPGKVHRQLVSPRLVPTPTDEPRGELLH